MRQWKSPETGKVGINITIKVEVGFGRTKKIALITGSFEVTDNSANGEFMDALGISAVVSTLMHSEGYIWTRGRCKVI